MLYLTTRTIHDTYTAARTLPEDRCPDGGFFVPMTFPQFRKNEIKKLGEKEFQIRYFTPAAEVDLCGHATIGSFKALLYGGYIEDNAFYMNHTLSGDLNIVVRDGFILMDMAVPVKINEIACEEGLQELYTIMGLSYEEQKAQNTSVSYSYDEVMDQLQEVGQRFAGAGKMDELTEIVEDTLGRGKKVSECTKKQLDAMVIILDNLQDRASELGI